MSQTNFAFPYKVLTCLGLWNFETQNEWWRRFYLTYQSWALLSLVVIMNFCFWDLYFVRTDVHKASTNLSASVCVFMLLWKNIQVLLKYPKIIRLQRLLTRCLQEPKDPREVRISQNLEKEIKRHYTIVYLMGTLTMTCWLLSGVVQTFPNGRKVLPLPMRVPWDYQTSPYYELGLLSQACAGYFVTFDVLSLNLTIFGTVMQICTLYDILVAKTEKINEWYGKICGNAKGIRLLTEEENLEAEKIIVNSIRYHQQIIGYVNLAEESYIDMMLVQFGGSALLITVVTLDLILVSSELNSRLITLIIFWFSLSADIFLFCYFGTLLMNKGQDYLKCLYEIPWEVMNTKNRKMFSIMIMRAQRQPRLTIQKFANIDFYSLLQLTKIVYNILYLLLHFAREKEGV